MKPIVEVNGLWKEYRRGAKQERYLSLRDSLFKGFNPQKKESFWALQDINFKVYPGDSLAIIGRNGAGKSTLLKILSRITPPTKGEIVLRGRLASLLEVGTGFHAELSGRENIFLNGSILGLKRQEIQKQFDAIVDFSGVEAFLDTPLKHYSSGMQLRLAFAVAAHLEPEILVIDEVLAVGDSAFQQKCIEKMTEVSQSGRTILFVSHNMQAVKNLCERGVLLNQGMKVFEDGIDVIISEYLKKENSITSFGKIGLSEKKRRESKRELEFATVYSDNYNIKPGESFSVLLTLKENKQKQFTDLLFGVNIIDNTGTCIYHLSNIFVNQPVYVHRVDSVYTFTIKEVDLKPGNYNVNLFVRANEEVQDWVMDAFTLQVLEGNIYNFSNSKMIQGITQPDFEFSF